MQEWKKDTSNTEDLLEKLKIDVFSDRIFVFTPTGDVIDLPQGATPIDFAYNIHSDIGDKCAGATINGKMVALNTELKNGDIVEVITSKNKKPSQAWLNLVKTSHAKNHIKRWFRKEDEQSNKESGLNMINEELKAIEGISWMQVKENKKNQLMQKFNFKTEDALLAAIGRGDISVQRVFQNILEQKEKIKKELKIIKPSERKELGVVIAGATGLKMHIAKCCGPAYPQQIVAYITIDKGASIHRINCKDLKLSKKEAKLLPAYWREEENIDYITIKIKTTDRVGMIQDVSHVMAELDINIHALNAASGTKDRSSEKEQDIHITAEVEIKNMDQLKRLIEKLKAVNGVLGVERI